MAILATVQPTCAQSNPTPQLLPYSQNFDSLPHSSTTYPAGWQGWTISSNPASSFNTGGPILDRALIAWGTATNTAGNVYNYDGKIGFLNSGSLDLTVGLAIDTRDCAALQVSYHIMTIRNPYDGSSNTRINEVTLQYRVGTTGTWTTLTGIEYQNNTTQQTSGTTPQNLQTKSITLPAECENQPVVQLRWASRQVSGSGSRPSFAVDNISVTGLVSCTNRPPLTVQPTDQTVCAMSPAQFVVATSAENPTYQWRLNGVPLTEGGIYSGTTSNVLTVTPTSSSQSVSAAFGYDCIVTAAGCWTNTVRCALTVYDPSVGGSASADPALICSNSSSQIILTGHTGSIVQWQYSANGITWFNTGQTNNPLSTGPLTASTYYRAIVQNGVCAAATSTVTMVTVTNALTPQVSIAIISGSNPICAGNSVTFKATPVHGGSAPTYVWKTNGVEVTGITGETFTETAPTNGERIDCRLISSEPCASPATADATPITMTVYDVATPVATAATLVLDTSFQANWNAATCATSYRLDVATDNTFDTFVPGYQDRDVGNVTSYIVSGLSPGTPYYYRVRAVGVSGTSGNSGTIMVTTLGAENVLAGWDVSTLSNYGPSPFAPTVAHPNVTVIGLTRGSGVSTTGTAAARAWGGANWTNSTAAGAIAENRFATFSITPNSGYKVSFTAISRFDYRRSDTGARTGVVQYATDGATFSNIATVAYTSSASGGASLPPIPLDTIAALQNVPDTTTVTFRIVNYGGTSSYGTWYIYDVANSPSNDFVVVGTVQPAEAAVTLNITRIERVGNDIKITWVGTAGTTNRVQFTPGLPNGSFSTNFTDIVESETVLTGSGLVTNTYTDVGGATNSPARYYRVRLVQ